jgi:hypothetical protein
MSEKYVVEIRGLSFVTVGTTDYGQDEPLEGGPEGITEPLRVDVYATNPRDAHRRVHETLQRLLQDNEDGDIARDRGPSSY